jgi:leader peptidase (prepilin peptidase) / N-methyltransferase
MFNNVFDANTWAAVPFHFWSVAIFVLGCGIGSFLNVCIYRMPIGESIVWPPSHCPNCQYHIPWYLNIPLLTWVALRGKCANCAQPISFRYFAVELLTGIVFLGVWLAYGRHTPGAALCYCVLLAGFIVASFIDFEHYIIPDEITLGGAAVGFILSFFVPSLHHATKASLSLERSFWGILIGAGIVYFILRVAKFFLGRETWVLAPDSTVLFGENGIKLPDKEVPFEDLFYRKTDAIVLRAKSARAGERSWENVPVRLTPVKLTIGEEQFDPETVPHLEVVTSELVVPREAMGLGDVKFMAAIGAFFGWEGALFSLMFSSVVGVAVTGILYLAKPGGHSSRIPYGPYIAIAATGWLFGGKELVQWWLYR